MPELPEVEGYRRFFERHAVGKRIAMIEVPDPRILRGTAVAKLRRELVGRTFRATRRHGKHLFADAGGIWLHLHFGMTGDLAEHASTDPAPRFAKVVFHFEDGSALSFEDMRLFGRVTLLDDPDTYLRRSAPGIDPLGRDFSLARFRRMLTNRKGSIKQQLMSQRVVAGVGNLYADEALFQSGIDPRRSASALSPQETGRLHRAVVRVLRKVIDVQGRGAELPRSWLFPNRERNEKCPRCHVMLQRGTVGGRTTYWCPRHQR